MNQSHLLDTHVFVWLLYNSAKLGPETVYFLKTSGLNAALSLVSIQELAYKHGAGKFAYSPKELLKNAEKLGLYVLDLRPSHLVTYPRITLPHKDPFDRLLLAQALSEGLTLLTADTHLLASPYSTLDARL